MSIIVIHGPPGTGKTTNARAFAELFGLDTIVDDGVSSHQPFPQKKVLVLTTRTPDEVRRWRSDSLRGAWSSEAIAFVTIATALRWIGAPIPISGSMGVRAGLLTLSEHTALTYLSGANTVATHHIARLCRHQHTASARDMMKHLERRGLAKGVSAPGGGRIYWWRITDAGRKVVQP